MLSMLNAQERKDILIWFETGVRNSHVPKLTNDAREKVCKMVRLAYKGKRLADIELLRIFNLFVTHQYLVKAAIEPRMGFPSVIQKVYDIRPYDPCDMSLLEMQLF